MNIGNYTDKFQMHDGSQNEESIHAVVLFSESVRIPEQKTDNYL